MLMPTSHRSLISLLQQKNALHPLIQCMKQTFISIQPRLLLMDSPHKEFSLPVKPTWLHLALSLMELFRTLALLKILQAGMVMLRHRASPASTFINQLMTKPTSPFNRRTKTITKSALVLTGADLPRIISAILINGNP
jgi:hypothetical protein